MRYADSVSALSSASIKKKKRKEKELALRHFELCAGWEEDTEKGISMVLAQGTRKECCCDVGSGCSP